MRELIQAYKNFAAGIISRDEFRLACRDYLHANPSARERANSLFSKAVQEGKMSALAWQAIADLFTGSAAATGAVDALVPGASPTRKVEATSADFSPMRVGSVLKDGRYTLVEELGSGGTGRVFKARDKFLEREGDPNPFVALKALNAVAASETGARTALTYEAMRVKKLSHDNIIRVDGFDYEGAQPFLTMEYLKGAPLDTLLATTYANGLPMVQAWPIIQSIGVALEYAHGKGVIHSDMKPSNVFITRKNVVKVLDFGISRPMPKSTRSETETGYVSKGPVDRLTIAYACLEQFYGMPPDPADDVYSFAMVIYELLTGKYPYEKRNTMEAFDLKLAPLRVDFLTRHQWEALRRAMAFRRDDRTKTIAELLRGLAPQTFIRKHRASILAIAATVITIGVFFGYRTISDYLERQMLPQEVPLPKVHVQLTPDQQHEIDDSLFLADDYLHDANVTLAPNDLAYTLSEGVNNVNQILDSVLAVDPGNERARQGKSRVADLYLAKARELLDKRQFDTALELATFGLKVQPSNLDLFRIKRDLCEKQPALCPAN